MLNHEQDGRPRRTRRPGALALQAVAHNVLAELRDTILLALLHLHIFFMTPKSVVLWECDANEITERSLQVSSERAVADLPEVRAHIESDAVECGEFCNAGCPSGVQSARARALLRALRSRAPQLRTTHM